MGGKSGPSARLVRDLMTVGVVTCSPETPITELARLMVEKHLEGIAVVTRERQTVGVVTQEELIRAYAHPDARSLTAEDVMRDDVPELPPTIPATAAAQLMQDMGVRVIFLMHDDQGAAWPAGVLSYHHLLRHLAAESDEELSDLGVRANREAPLDTFIRKRDAARRQRQHPNQE